MLQLHMTDRWDRHADEWDEDENARSYAAFAYVSLLEHVDILSIEWKKNRVLDFGCGTGLLSEKLAPLVKEIIAVDTSQKMIDVLRGKRIGNINPICENIDGKHHHAFANVLMEFELITASSVCSFLPDYEAMLGLLVKSLVPNGYFVQWDWLRVGDEEFGLTADRVSNAIRGTGLKCVYVGKAFTLTIENEEMPVLIGIGRLD